MRIFSILGVLGVFVWGATPPVNEIEDFLKVLDTVKHRYVNEYSEAELLNFAISGMLRNLDPHSDYYSKDYYLELKNSTDGKFGGIGIEIAQKDNFIKIIAPIDETPATDAGLLSGDIILEIENQSTKGMNLSAASKLMRGDPGSILNLKILREGEAPFKVQLIRSIIGQKSVKYNILNEDIGYLRIAQFQHNTKQEVIGALKNLKASGAASFIVDLRNNPGGVFEAAYDVANIFLDRSKLGYNGVIVSSKGRDDSKKTDKDNYLIATGKDLIENANLVILVDHGTASSSEIMAAALQDHKRAIVVGTKTFGKGSVQSIYPLSKTSAIKMTTALYYTPSGRSIQAKGINPDILVPLYDIDESSKLEGYLYAEGDLIGHIDNPDTKGVEKNIKLDIAYKKALPHVDYQLFEAVNVLRMSSVLAGRS